MMNERNGMDALNYLLLAAYIVLELSDIVAKSYVMTLLGLVCLGWMLFRIFSKNLPKRKAENDKLVHMGAGLKKEALFQKQRWTDRSAHLYKKCPNCKKVLRAKRIRGKRVITCPHCHHEVTLRCVVPGELDKAAKKAAKEARKNS